jgi:DNA-binding MarR family transcriptional regulator
MDENDAMGTNKPYLRRLLLNRSDWMEQRLYANAELNGYGDVTAAMSRLFAHLAGRPVGLSELARRLTVTRQAVHKLASEAARLGYVEFIDCEKDARVKLLGFTQKGWDMAESAEAELDAIEADLARQIGAEQLAALKAILSSPWSKLERSRQREKGRTAPHQAGTPD